MTSRSRAVATFFAVAMATTLLAAFFQSQIRRPLTAEASALESAAASATPAPGAPLTLDTFRNIVKSKNAGVVNITISAKPKAAARGGRQLPFPFFGDDDPLGPGEQNQRAGGSGFIIDADGTILTNRHVVDEADGISVTLLSGKRYDAKVLGKDARTDVAVIKIEPKEPLTVLELGDSEAAEVGEWVMAIGSPFGFGNSLSVGVVSGKGRNLTLGQQGTGVDMIQTDAAINPGNSGGPLMNTRGQVIGINTLIITQGLAQNAGVGFSVPINVAKPIIPQLKSKGKVTRGWLGVQIQSASEDIALTFKRDSAQGVVVTDVTKDSPAEKAGIQLEDYIFEVDGRLVKDNTALTSYISGLAPGTTVSLKLIRVEKNAQVEKSVRITLGTFPEGPTAAAGREDAEDDKSDEKPATNLGIELQTLSPTLRERMDLPDSVRGVVVRSVEAGGAAELAGLARGDVIIMVSGEEVSSVKEFNSAIRKAAPAKVARLRVRRGETVLVVALRLDR
ncbi:MAG: Do family serine endopeptidase [Vicinamibacteria bacterium]|nr:Do family serine endopeptidase [Vicinamibacteria bacterium]